MHSERKLLMGRNASACARDSRPARRKLFGDKAVCRDRWAPGQYEIRSRKPKGSGPARRGPKAGLPRSYQTDPHKHLTWEDLLALIDAERFANSIGLPLTAFLTVTWRSAPEFNAKRRDSWQAHQERLCAALRIFLRDHKITPAYAFVRERVVGMGAHTHFFVHIPSKRWTSVKRKLEKHLLAAGGFSNPRAVKITGDRNGGRGIVHESQRSGVLQYLAKGINPNEMVPTGAGTIPLPTFLGIRPQKQATIPGQRIGCTRNIGPAARKKAGYRDMSTLLELANALPAGTP